MSHWDRNAEVWRSFGPPLRPHEQDIEFFRRTARADRDAVLLGVTPELSEYGSLPSRFLTAVDSSPGMIRLVWPGSSPYRKVLRGSWASLPLPEASADVALGDGCTTGMFWPGEYARVGSELARVLRPGGELHLRCFCRTGSESLAEVVKGYESRGFGSFHALKLRAAVSLQNSVREGVPVARILEWMVSQFGPPEAIAERTGWPVEEVRTVESYRGSETVYRFPNVMEVAESLSKSFRFRETWTGSYEGAENCPHLVLRRR